MKHINHGLAETAGEIVVTLDYETVVLPARRHSLNSIRSYLESVALASQRVLGEFMVDGYPVDLSMPLDKLPFRRVDAVTVPLSELPCLLLTTAGQQASRARAAVEAALTLVLINSPSTARELWWNIASLLKEPVLSLSLMPDHLCQLWCGATFYKLRQWQIEQVSLIVRRVDETCDLQDNIRLSDALENLVLPWLDRLTEHIRLWQHVTQASARLGINHGAV